MSMPRPRRMPLCTATKPINGGPSRKPNTAMRNRMATLAAAGLSFWSAAAVTASGKPTETPKPMAAKRACAV